MQNERPFTGYRVLIIEDEVVQAWELSGMIADMGGTIGSAILDLNLDGIYAYPITRLLQQLGVPFVFCTAYAEAVDVFSGVSDVPRLNKPVLARDLRDTILLILSRARSDSPRCSNAQHRPRRPLAAARHSAAEHRSDAV